jgi:hypothetical protein
MCVAKPWLAGVLRPAARRPVVRVPGCARQGACRRRRRHVLLPAPFHDCGPWPHGAATATLSLKRSPNTAPAGSLLCRTHAVGPWRAGCALRRLGAAAERDGHGAPRQRHRRTGAANRPTTLPTAQPPSLLSAQITAQPIRECRPYALPRLPCSRSPSTRADMTQHNPMSVMPRRLSLYSTTSFGCASRRTRLAVTRARRAGGRACPTTTAAAWWRVSGSKCPDLLVNECRE